MSELPIILNEIIEVGETQRADLNPAAVYVASLSQGSSQTGTRSALKRVAELVGTTPDELPWHQLRHAHVAALRTRLAEIYAPSTCNKMLSAIRGVVRQAWLLGLCTSEEAQLVAAVKNVRGSRLPAGRALTRAELVALFEACHDKYNIHAGLRDQACFAMLYGLGLRRAEAAAAKIEDYAADAGELRVIGKGGKERLAFVHGVVEFAAATRLRSGRLPTDDHRGMPGTSRDLVHLRDQRHARMDSDRMVHRVGVERVSCLTTPATDGVAPGR